MKYLFLILYFGICTILLGRDWLDDNWDKAGATWREKWTNTFNQIKELSTNEQIKILGTAVRAKSTTGGVRQTSEDQLAVANQAIQTLIAIPGHAEYYDKRIREAYAPLKGPNPNTFIHSAQNEMMYGFETLMHLPSPETVKVLGGMLSETWRLPPTGEYTPPELALPAMTSLGDLSIRNAPWKPIKTSDDLPGSIPAWQAWWEEIKSGSMAFSFKGQNVEYRFKPDGTWDTIALVDPPDDAPKPPTLSQAKKEQIEKAVPKAREKKETQRFRNGCVWIVVAMMVLLAAFVWLRCKKRIGWG